VIIEFSRQKAALARARVWHPELSDPPDGSCPPVGRHRYRWDGTQLIETR
jgi:hypothetical protein